MIRDEGDGNGPGEGQFTAGHGQKDPAPGENAKAPTRSRANCYHGRVRLWDILRLQVPPLKRRLAAFVAPFTDPADQWQVQLLRRVLAIALVLTVFLCISDWATGRNPWFAAGAIAVVLTGMGVTDRRQQLGRRVAAGLFLAAVLLLILTAWDDRSSMSPALCLVILPGMLATMFEGPGFGGFVSGLTVAGLLALALAFPPASTMNSYRLVNEAMMVCLGYLLAWGADHTFHRLQRSSLAQAQALEQNTRLGRAMAHALFQDLGPLLQDLQARLDGPRPADAAMRPMEALVAKLNEARHLYGAQAPHPGAEPRPDDDARPALARIAVGVLAGVQAVLLTRNLLWGGPSMATGAVTLALVLLLLPGMAWRPRAFPPARVGGLVLLLCYLTLLKASLGWRGGADSPNLVLVPSLMILASLLNGRAVVALTFVAGAAMLGWAAWSQPLRLDQVRLLTNLVVLQVILGFIAFSVVQLRQAFLDRLRGQARALDGALSLRRRLAGTLFHDVNNQLSALAASLELARLGEDPEGMLATARRLGLRIERLVQASRGFLLDGEPVDESALRQVPVTAIFQDVEALFQSRARGKGQTLIFIGESGMAVLGLPEIVTESVLGNLVSNAIKFSPQGAIIEVEALRQGGEVALRVRDAGPGIPPALIDALAAEGPLPSSPGSAGEAGQGFGLKLVREHLQRQGGRLELSQHPRGGALAVAWLRAV